MKLLIKNASQIVQISSTNQLYKIGNDMKNIALLKATKDEGLSVAVDETGKIAALGTNSEVSTVYPNEDLFTEVIDATGQSVLPGLVDAHTHPVWAGDRVHEFAMKLGGASYLEIHEAGGGIHFTVEHTRKASFQMLKNILLKRLNRMIKTGTTLAECKSGYGLDTETELKMLKVIESVKNEVSMDLSSTYCGAHAVPKGKTAEEATLDVIEKQISSLKEAIDKKELSVDNIDVFCEKGVFNVDQTKNILQAGRSLGLNINFHAEELNYLGGAEMGASLSAEAISHLEEVSDEAIDLMASSKTVGVLLPTTAHLLRLPAPPARKMIEKGVPVALGSDFNPNAYCSSMPLVMSLACVQLRMSLEEALVASTLNAAYSVRKSNQTGSLEVGKDANIIIIAAPRWEHLIYQLGESSEIISHVIYKGKVAHSNNPKDTRFNIH